MSLSLISGPTAVTVLNSLVDGSFKADTYAALWLDGWGLLALNGDTGAGLDYFAKPYIILPNAKATMIGGRWDWDSFGWYAELGRLILQDGSYWNQAAFPSTGYFPGESLQYESLSSQRAFGVMNDRVLRASGSLIRASAWGSTSETTEFTFPSATTSGTGLLHYAGQEGGKHLWWMVSSGNGRVFKYNATDHSEIPNTRTSFGSAITSCGYSVKHRLWFVLRVSGSTTNLYVYSTEPVASTISNPTLSSAVSKGGTRTLSATVLGSLSEPCVGRNVTFSTTHGTVDPATVATDATGKASTTFYAPNSTVAGGTLTATLTE